MRFSTHQGFACAVDEAQPVLHFVQRMMGYILGLPKPRVSCPPPPKKKKKKKEEEKGRGAGAVQIGRV